MARVPLGISGSSKTGEPVIPPVAADTVSGNSVANNGETILLIANTGSTAHTLAVQLAATVDGQPVNPRVYSLAVGQSIIAGPYPTWWYGTTLLLDSDSSEVALSVLAPGPGRPVPGSASAPFTRSGLVAVADMSAAGLSQSGQILIVDAGIVGASTSGAVLIVPV